MEIAIMYPHLRPLSLLTSKIWFFRLLYQLISLLSAIYCLFNLDLGSKPKIKVVRRNIKVPTMNRNHKIRKLFQPFLQSIQIISTQYHHHHHNIIIYWSQLMVEMEIFWEERMNFSRMLNRAKERYHKRMRTNMNDSKK